MLALKGITCIVSVHAVVPEVTQLIPGRCRTRNDRLCLVTGNSVFNLPMHFASQIAARTDIPQALLNTQSISSCSNSLSTLGMPPRDNTGRTLSRVAASGPSTRATQGAGMTRPFGKGGRLSEEDAFTLLRPASTCGLTLNKVKNVNHSVVFIFAQFLLPWGSLAGRWSSQVQPKFRRQEQHYETYLPCNLISDAVNVGFGLVHAGVPLSDQRREAKRRYTLL